MNNLFDLTGRKAIVTGGRNGLLGPIWVETLEQAGAEVEIIDLPEVNLKSGSQVKFWADNYIPGLGVPDIIIHNAGIDAPPAKDAKSDFWGNTEIMDVNYHGGVRVIKEFWERMKKKEGVKHIIFIGSLLGNVSADHRNYANGFDKPVTYGASKRALYALTQNLATRGAPYNILVNMLSFSMVEGKGITDEFRQKFLKSVPLGRPIYKDDLQRALMGLLIQSYITGQEVKFFGGYDCW